jgi:cytochrome c biogenesis protein CcmG/thiol:disulfide interchange protein DsbE
MTSDVGEQEIQQKSSFRATFFIVPLAVVMALVGLFYFALHAGDPSRLPSALIGKPAPQFSLAPIEGIAETGKASPGFSTADLAKGEVTLVNVWASWCGPCIQEHPILTRLKKEHGLRLLGINYKDAPDAAKRFLNRLGNPYDAIGADVSGRVAIDWGVYGVPETYVVDGRGQIVHRYVGPLSEDGIEKELMPAIEAARRRSAQGAGDKTS